MPAPVIPWHTLSKAPCADDPRNEERTSWLRTYLRIVCLSLSQPIILWNRTASSWHVKRMIIHSASPDSDPLVFVCNWA